MTDWVIGILLAYLVVVTGLGVIMLGLRIIMRKLDLILRKLNNSQPDDEGGY